MPLPVLVVVAGAIAAIAGGAEVGNNYRISDQNKQNADKALDDSTKAQAHDRDVMTGEWNRISQGFTGKFAPAQAACEAFKAWPHQRIWDALHGAGEFTSNGGISQADVAAGSNGWRGLQQTTGTAANEFHTNIQKIITEKWRGRAATAAMQATLAHTDKVNDLLTTFEMVANGIGQMQSYLGQAKNSVQQPVHTSAFDKFIGHIPGNGILKTAAHRSHEAEAAAQDVMSRIYQPAVTHVDGHTPILPVPHNPTNPGPPGPTPPSTPSPGGPTHTSPTSTIPTNTGPTQTTNPQTDPNHTPDQQQTSGGQPTAPTGPTPTTPSPETSPASAAPTTPSSYLQDPLGRSTTSPGSPGGVTTPDPGGALPDLGSPAQPPGKASPAPPSGTRSATPGGLGKPGRGGLPGMPAAPALKKDDDEKEHHSPDYLVYERSNELIGDLPPTLPPGGVIGE